MQVSNIPYSIWLLATTSQDSQELGLLPRIGIAEMREDCRLRTVILVTDLPTSARICTNYTKCQQ